MGRSVNYLNNAEVKIFFRFESEFFENGEFDEDSTQINWDDLEQNLICEIQSKFPSYETVNKWEDNEVHIFLQNKLCNIALSEYCGLVSLSVAPRDSGNLYGNETYRDNFAVSHALSIEKTLQRIVKDLTGQVLVKVGSFSNGEGVYEKVSI